MKYENIIQNDISTVKSVNLKNVIRFKSDILH